MPPMRSKNATLLSWTCQVVAAAILAQTLFFKFSGAPESVHIFTQLGVEPWGRFASGVAELVVAVMLLMPRTAALGALAAIAMMVGAVGAHLTRLGVEIRLPDQSEGDGGLLFALALLTIAASATVVFLRRAELPRLRATAKLPIR